MGELRRTEAGIFDESKIYTLDELEKADEKSLRKMIIPAEKAIKKVLPFAEADKSALRSLHTGRPLLKSNLKKIPKLENGEHFALFCEGDFVGIYKKIQNESIFAKSEFVFN